jgi:DNA-binding Lrp family transcriptional regulator
MKKKTSFSLGKKDAALVGELEKNGRASISKIAKSMGVSKEVANYRLRRLMDAGFIRGFYPVIDYFSLGCDSYRLLLNLSNFNEKILDKITSELRAIEGVTFSVFLQSDRDLEVIVRAPRTNDFYDFYDGFIRKYSAYIQDKEFSLATKAYILRHDYLHRSAGAITIDQSRSGAVDEADKKILSELKKNARMPTVEIAKHTRLSSYVVKYRIKQMMKNQILKGFMPVLDVSLLGYDTYKVFITLNNPGKRNTVVQLLMQNPHTTKITELIGKSDLEVKMDFRTVLELEKFLRELRSKVPYIRKFAAIPLAKD